MESDFFVEDIARRLGKQDILIVGIPKIEAKKDPFGNLTIEAYLPAPDNPAYSNTREGRIKLEANPEKPLEKLVALKNGESVSVNGPLRGIPGGMVYIWDGQFVLQSKFYPKSGDKYLSCFSGLSSSFRDIQNPLRVCLREGLEEFVITDNGTLYVPEFNEDVTSGAELTQTQVDELSQRAYTHLTASLAKEGIDFSLYYNHKHFKARISKGRDCLIVRDSDGKMVSHNKGVLEVNPMTNDFNLLQIAHLQELPKVVNFYEAEFGNNIALIPFEQLGEIWGNWGKETRVLSYTRRGGMRELDYKGHFDTLVQRAAMSLGIIKGDYKFDYKTYGEKSV